jgi:hypothetical protein
MKRWQVLAVLALLIAVNVGGWGFNKASNSIHSVGGWGSDAEAGSEGGDILYYGLSPSNGAYYRLEISSSDGHRFNALFTNESDMIDAVYDGAPIRYLADRSVFNVTSVTLEGQLPEGSEAYAFMIVSAEPGVMVHIDSHSGQASFPPSLQPALQAAYFACRISSISLLFLLVYSYDKYRTERRMGH